MSALQRSNGDSDLVPNAISCQPCRDQTVMLTWFLTLSISAEPCRRPGGDVDLVPNAVSNELCRIPNGNVDLIPNAVNFSWALQTTRR